MANKVPDKFTNAVKVILANGGTTEEIISAYQEHVVLGPINERLRNDLIKQIEEIQNGGSTVDPTNVNQKIVDAIRDRLTKGNVPTP